MIFLFLCLQGDIHFNNITVDSDKFGAVFALPIEKYWEVYWKYQIKIYAVDELEIANMKIEFYFIQFRSRIRKAKN